MSSISLMLLHFFILGKTKIRVVSNNPSCSNTNEALDVIVTRKERIIDRVFTGSVATLVSTILVIRLINSYPYVKIL